MTRSETNWDKILDLYAYAIAGGRGQFVPTARGMMQIISRIRRAPAFANAHVTTADLALHFTLRDTDDPQARVVLYWERPGSYAVYIGLPEPPYYLDLQSVPLEAVVPVLRRYLARLRDLGHDGNAREHMQ